MKLKRKIIHLLTRYLAFNWLRRLYINFSALQNKIKYGDSTFPRIITIEISSHCNRACTYYPNVVAPQKPKLIDPELFELIAKRIGDIKYSGVVDFIFFSEPTLHPRLAEYVAMVKKYAPNCIPRISTNGDILNTERVKSYVDAGMDRIYVMRHVPTPEGWVENIDRLAEEFPGVFVKMDIEELENTIGLNNFGGVVETKRVLDGGKTKDGSPSCTIHTHVAQITVTGDWNLCCTDYAKTYKFGNLKDKSILEIWNDSRFVKMRKELRSGIARLQVCKDCFIFSNNKKYMSERGLKTFSEQIDSGEAFSTVSRTESRNLLSKRNNAGSSHTAG